MFLVNYLLVLAIVLLVVAFINGIRSKVVLSENIPYLILMLLGLILGAQASLLAGWIGSAKILALAAFVYMAVLVRAMIKSG